MNKKVIYGDEARKALIKGANVVADVVKVTIGAKGKNVVIEKEAGLPQIINDGISIAKEVELEDPAENAGAKLIQEAALKANDTAGDGSTTTCVLVQAMLNEGNRVIENGCNAVEIKKGMQYAAHEYVNELDNIAIPVNNEDAIKQVATVSAGNDEEIGKIIQEAINKVGKDGIVTVGESKTFDTTLEVTDGMQFDRGYVSQYFATDMEKGEAVYDNAYVLCVNKSIGTTQEFIPLLEAVAREGKALLLIADDIEGEALATLVTNNFRKIIKVVAVKAPDYGDNRKNKLEDIAALTGGKCANDQFGFKLSEFTINDLGVAERVVVTKDHTTIVVKDKTPELVERANLIRAQITTASTDYEESKLKERLAKLVSGVAVIKVGALTEVEMKEKKLRIEDALNATKAAVVEGVVAGGGVALFSIKDEPIKIFEGISDDFIKGINIVKKALVAPLAQIVKNAGLSSELIMAEIEKASKEQDKNTIGYDVLTDEYVDMVERGIIDPVKVTKSALLNSTSVASLLLTTEAAIVKAPEKEDALNLNTLMQR